MQERVDAAGAIAAWASAATAGANVSLDDFVPKWDEAQRPSREQMAPEQIIAFMRSLQRRNPEQKR